MVLTSDKKRWKAEKGEKRQNIGDQDVTETILVTLTYQYYFNVISDYYTLDGLDSGEIVTFPFTWTIGLGENRFTAEHSVDDDNSTNDRLVTTIEGLPN